jgi:phosphatidylglycerophosphate synthase
LFLAYHIAATPAVADKLMVSTALILLSGRYGKYVAIPSSVILAREIAVSALREWMAQKQLRDSVKVGFQGKVKTAATMVALTILLMVPAEDGAAKILPSFLRIYTSGLVLLYLSALITITSGLEYFKAAAPTLLSDKI